MYIERKLKHSAGVLFDSYSQMSQQKLPLTSVTPTKYLSQLRYEQTFYAQIYIHVVELEQQQHHIDFSGFNLNDHDIHVCVCTRVYTF